MTGLKQLSAQVRLVAWGYFFLYLNFNINGWNILPAFVGWYLFEKAIQGLKEEQPKLLLLENFCWVLLAWSVLEWLPLDLDSQTWLGLPGLVIQLMTMYFHFQLLTEVGELAGRYRDATPRKDHARCILKARTGAVVLQTALVLVMALPLTEDWMTAAAAVLLALQLGFCVYTMGELFSLAKGLEALAQAGDAI